MELPPIEDVKVRIVEIRKATGEDFLTLPPEQLVRCDDPLSLFYGETFVYTTTFGSEVTF